MRHLVVVLHFCPIRLSSNHSTDKLKLPSIWNELEGIVRPNSTVTSGVKTVSYVSKQFSPEKSETQNNSLVCAFFMSTFENYMLDRSD